MTHDSTPPAAALQPAIAGRDSDPSPRVSWTLPPAEPMTPARRRRLRLEGAARDLFDACTFHNRTIHDSRGRAREPLLSLDDAERNVRCRYRYARSLAIAEMIAGRDDAPARLLKQALDDAADVYFLAGGRDVRF